MAQTNHGSIEFLKFPNPQYPGDKTRMIKKWLRDSWARRKITDLQSQITTLFDSLLYYAKKIEIAYDLYALGGSASAQITITDYGSYSATLPKSITVRDNTYGRPMVVSNWWLGGTKLIVVINNLGAARGAGSIFLEILV